MRIVKFRNRQTRNFEFYCKVPKEYVRKISSLLAPSPFNPPLQFWIDSPSQRILPPDETNAPPAVLLPILHHSYYIESGMIYSEISYPGVGMLIKENFTRFRVYGHPWQPIQNIWMGNYAIVSFEEKIFCPLSSMHFADLIIDNEEIKSLNLEEKAFDELKKHIQITEMIMI